MHFLSRVNESIEKGAPFCLVTVISSNMKNVSAGQKAIVSDTETIEATFGSEEFAQKVNAHAQVFLRQKKSGLVKIEDQAEIFFNVLAPEAGLLICGAGHIAIPLAQFSLQAGFNVTVLDDRTDFANTSRFPGCNVMAENFTLALREMNLGPNSFAVVITRGHEHDTECLQEILQKKSAYVGLIGSRRRVQFVLEMLKREGIPQNRLGEVFTPIGIPIGAESPVEIAISIVAELVCVLRKGSRQARALRAAIGVTK